MKRERQQPVMQAYILVILYAISLKFALKVVPCHSNNAIFRKR